MESVLKLGNTMARMFNIATGHRYSDLVLQKSRCWQEMLTSES